MEITSWRQYPICVLGYDIRRWESIHKTDIYDPTDEKKLVVWKYYADKGPTHLQYWSNWGFLLTWPLCFHIWYQFKPQQFDQNGHRIPGSENLVYFRIGIGRWQAEDGGYMVPTLYLGGHWD